MLGLYFFCIYNICKFFFNLLWDLLSEGARQAGNVLKKKTLQASGEKLEILAYLLQRHERH